MATVEEYIKRISGPQKEVAIRLREIIKKAAPEAAESVKWAQPVYEENGPFAFIRAGKFHVTFGFWRGAQLKDPKRLLDGEGDRMRHLKLTDADAIPEAAVTAFVKQAVKLNQEMGDPTATKGARKAAAKKAAAKQAAEKKSAAKRSAATRKTIAKAAATKNVAAKAAAAKKAAAKKNGAKKTVAKKAGAKKVVAKKAAAKKPATKKKASARASKK